MGGFLGALCAASPVHICPAMLPCVAGVVVFWCHNHCFFRVELPSPPSDLPYICLRKAPCAFDSWSMVGVVVFRCHNHCFFRAELPGSAVISHSHIFEGLLLPLRVGVGVAVCWQVSQPLLKTNRSTRACQPNRAIDTKQRLWDNHYSVRVGSLCYYSKWKLHRVAS